MRVRKNLAVLYLQEDGPILSTDLLSLSQQQQLEEFLDRLAELFEQLKILPPARECDHQIPLKQEYALYKSRPYKYPHYLKSEI